MDSNVASLILFTFFVIGIAHGQAEKEYDSIRLFQKNYKKNRFEIGTASVKTMSISQYKPRRATYPAGEILEDIGRTGLTLLANAIWGEYTETAIGDSDEVDWKLSSRINCPDPNFDWEIQIFTKGMHHKEIYAYGSDIGSNREREVWWDENTNGVLLHQKDTIGRFMMFVRPDINYFIETMAPNDHEQRKLDIMNDLMTNFGQGNLFLWDMDYAIIGKFRGEDFAAVSSEQAGKFWIFRNGLVEAILQLPTTGQEEQSGRSEARYLLISQSRGVNHYDGLRLSMLYYYFRSNFE